MTNTHWIITLPTFYPYEAYDYQEGRWKPMQGEVGQMFTTLQHAIDCVQAARREAKALGSMVIIEEIKNAH